MIPQVMGVLNVTPDSFSDGGAHAEPAAALERARAMVAEGAAVIDVGGESTRPGAASVPLEVELARVVPVVAAVSELGVRVSVDTRRAEVARAAVAAGATIVNDVGATLGPVAAELGVGWVAVHMAGEPATMQDDPRYGDVVSEVRDRLVELAEAASTAGVSELWIDPGFGFGKTLEHNLALVGCIDELVATGWPVLLGVSRKRTLGLLGARADLDASVPETAVDDRLEAGLAMATWAMASGVTMVRAHDVRAHVRAARVVAGRIERAA